MYMTKKSKKLKKTDNIVLNSCK